MSTTGGFATGILNGGRSTLITGLDFKSVAGLDMKIVDFACDVKINEVKLTAEQLVELEGFVARKRGIHTGVVDMQAEAISTLKLHI